MGMEIVRLSNLSWLRIPDRQVLAMREVTSALDSSAVQPDGFFAGAPQRVPTLDWPATLFDNEALYH